MEGSVLKCVLQVKTCCLERASYFRLQSLHRSGGLDDLTGEPGSQSGTQDLKWGGEEGKGFFVNLIEFIETQHRPEPSKDRVGR